MSLYRGAADLEPHVWRAHLGEVFQAMIYNVFASNVSGAAQEVIGRIVVRQLADAHLKDVSINMRLSPHI